MRTMILAFIAALGGDIRFLIEIADLFDISKLVNETRVDISDPDKHQKDQTPSENEIEQSLRA